MGFYDAIRVGASGAVDSAYAVDRSLRFNDDDSTHLSRTPSSASNRKTWTISTWIKRGVLGDNKTIFNAYDGGSSRRFRLFFNSSDQIEYNQGGDANSGLGTSTAKFRDINAWYHFVFVADYTNGTAANRFKVYVNGSEISMSFSDNVENADGQWNGNWEHDIGVIGSSTYPFDGYLAEINVIDGQAYDPSYFAETNAVTGQWNPKKYTGSYGTNGFYLNFSDNSGTTATTLGKDSSGNGNNYTPNNFSVSAGAGNDSLEDTPTNNFCTLNPLDKMGTVTVSEGNLKVVINGDNASLITGSFGVSSGKWYYEAVASDANGFVGWIRPDVSSYTSYPYQQSGSLIYFSANGSRYKDGDGGASYGAAYGNGDIIGCAINLDDNQVTWYKNNSSQGTISITAGSYHPNTCAGGSSSTFTFNFGQRAFSYTPPTGFQALSSANLPDPTILLPNKHFEARAYTGTGAGNTQTLTGFQFAPDWVWGKSRTTAYNHGTFDTVRGATNRLWPNLTNAEASNNAITAFTSDGYSVSTDAFNENSQVTWNWNAGDTDGKTYTVTVVSDSGNKYRFDGFGTSAVTLELAEGGTYIFNYPSAHPLKFSTTSDGTHGGGSEYTTGVTHNSSTQVTIVVAASAPTLYYYCSIHSGMGGQVNTNSTLGSSNFDGTIQSTVKVNASAGFSITTYTGTGSSSTVGHGLGVKPDAIIIKCRSNTDNWMVYHNQANAGVDPEDYYAELNSTSSNVNSTAMLNDTAPTSNSVTIGSDNSVNGSSRTYVMYCFSAVSSYSKFGLYKANGVNTDGPFVYTGFRPAWVMIKGISLSNQNWQIFDNTRNTFNKVDNVLAPNTSAAESTDNYSVVDFLANGFKITGLAGSFINYNPSYPDNLYFAFAESPFKNSRAR